MANGILVIANNIPGVNSLIKNAYNGILIDNNQSELFISEIKKIISNKNLIYKYSNESKSTAKKFDRVFFLKEYSKLLHSIKYK